MEESWQCGSSWIKNYAKLEGKGSNNSQNVGVGGYMVYDNNWVGSQWEGGGLHN